MKQQNPLQTFIAYSRNDIAYLQKLKQRLRTFERKNEIKVWYDGEMTAGTYWNEAITEKLENADIILLLVSTDSLASDYFYEKEMQKALTRHQKDLLVIPIILKPCLWEEEIELSNIQTLPKDGTAITKWLDKDEVYVNIAQGIKASFPRARNLRDERTKRQEKERNDRVLILERKLAEKEEELERVLEENEKLSKITGKVALDELKQENKRLKNRNFRIKLASDDLKRENKSLQYEIVKLEDDKTNLRLNRINQSGKLGFIDKNGNIVIDFIYSVVSSSFSEGFLAVFKNSKWGYIDKTGKVIIDFVYDYADHFSEGLARVQKNSKWGFIDKAGKVIIDFVYDDADHFSEGLARIQKNSKWGFIDKAGKVIIDFVYDNYDGYNPIGYFSEELAYVLKDNKFGFIDKTGKEIIDFVYDDADHFSEGLAKVKKGGKYGFIDKIGKTVINFIYDFAYLFSDGLAKVNKDGRIFYINKKGERVEKI